MQLKNYHLSYPEECKKELQLPEQLSIIPSICSVTNLNSGLDPKTAIVIDNLIKEITEERNITTIINSHDMNSVMEIGEKSYF